MPKFTGCYGGNYTVEECMLSGTVVPVRPRPLADMENGGV